MKEIGVYIHIPFCVSKCAYCDFYSLPGCAQTDTLKRRYVDAIKRQFDWATKKYGKLRAKTVFIGGGTPTVLETELLCDMIHAIKTAFDLTPKHEFTIEANPKTFDITKLTALREQGVNRLSLGVQSANDSELSVLGRIHSFNEAKHAIDLTRKAGFDNISVDLMYGIPYQTEQSFIKSVAEVIGLSPEHISVYGLQLEQDTPLYRQKDTLPFPNEEEAIQMYSRAISLLAENGYNRYEISNFSKPGYESKHNLGYWNQCEYLGFGSGAYSFFDNTRFSCESDAQAFCECKDFESLLAVDEVIDGEEAAKEFVMLALRLSNGFSEKELFDRTRNAELYINKCIPYVKSGFMRRENGRIFFTEQGFNVSNTILAEMLF